MYAHFELGLIATALPNSPAPVPPGIVINCTSLCTPPATWWTTTATPSFVFVPGAPTIFHPLSAESIAEP